MIGVSVHGRTPDVRASTETGIMLTRSAAAGPARPARRRSAAAGPARPARRRSANGWAGYRGTAIGGTGHRLGRLSRHRLTAAPAIGGAG